MPLNSGDSNVVRARSAIKRDITIDQYRLPADGSVVLIDVSDEKTRRALARNAPNVVIEDEVGSGGAGGASALAGLSDVGLTGAVEDSILVRDGSGVFNATTNILVSDTGGSITVDSAGGSVEVVDGTFIARDRTSSSDNVFTAAVAGEDEDRFRINASGTVSISDGTNPADVHVSRQASGVIGLGAGEQFRVQQDPVADNDLSRKKYVDDLVVASGGASLPSASVLGTMLTYDATASAFVAANPGLIRFNGTRLELDQSNSVGGLVIGGVTLDYNHSSFRLQVSGQSVSLSETTYFLKDAVISGINKKIDFQGSNAATNQNIRFIAGSQPTFAIQHDGKLLWGDGTAVVDCQIARESADLISTPDRFKALDGVTTKIKAGVPTDGDFAQTPEDGTLVVDTTNSKIYVRIGGSWVATAALT